VENLGRFQAFFFWNVFMKNMFFLVLDSQILISFAQILHHVSISSQKIEGSLNVAIFIITLPAKFG
jgi:hypothetical protein